MRCAKPCLTNNPLNHADPTGHCGTTGLKATAVSVMSGDCTRRAYDMLTKAKTTEGKVISGAVMVGSALGAAAGWVGGAILTVAGGEAVAGAVAGGGTAVAATETGGAVAASACADGDCRNEVSQVGTLAAHSELIDLSGVNRNVQSLQTQIQGLLTKSDEVSEHTTLLLNTLARRQEIVINTLNKINGMPGDQLKGEMLRSWLHDLDRTNKAIEALLKKLND